MTKEIKIKIIDELKSELININLDNYNPYHVKLKSLMVEIFGENSVEHNYVSNKHLFLLGYSELHTLDNLNKSKNQVLIFLDNCINKLKLQTPKKEAKQNIFYRMSNGTAVTVIIFLLSGISYVSFEFGKIVARSEKSQLSNPIIYPSDNKPQNKPTNNSSKQNKKIIHSDTIKSK